MSIPGANILKAASRVIAQQAFTYFPFVTRALQPNGLWTATYAAGQPLKGTAQPIPRVLYANMGLDFQKNYYNFFMPQRVLDVARDIAGDQFTFEGKNFQAISKTNWHGIDGWIQCLCVQVPNF